MNFNNVILDQKGTFNGIGTLRSSAGQLAQHGILDPGLPMGSLVIDGDLPESTDATVRIQLGGRNAGIDFDVLKVTGNATLRGALKIELAGGFVPADGDRFTIMEFASHTSNFDSLVGLNLSPLLYLEPIVSPTNVVLQVHARPQPIFTLSGLDQTLAPTYTLSNVAGQSFVIETKSLINQLNWTPVLTNLNSSAAFEFHDDDHVNFPTRFFRARLIE
jgi:hypothetical protein